MLTKLLIRFLVLGFLLASLSKDVYAQVRQDSVPAYLSLKVFSMDEGIDLIGYNSNYGPITAYAKLKGKDSVVMERVISPRDSLLLMKVPGDNEEAARDSLIKVLSFGYFLGDALNINPDANYLYRLPFRKGKKYKINQGANGKFSHNHPVSRYAIDFDLQIGDPVYAARDGLVVTAIDWLTRNGGRELIDFANRIVILHDDGTLASYVHLEPNGVLVAEGERVTRGQLIGRSGNTGFTRGPHLHFVVRDARDISIPVQFEGYENIELKKGMKVRLKK